jgi:hypothetical protein
LSCESFELNPIKEPISSADNLESPPIKALEKSRKSGFVQTSQTEGLSKSKVLAGDNRIIIETNLPVLKTESS